MPKKQPDLKQTFLQKYPLMQQRVDAQNKGLTLRQSKLALYMLTYLQEREKTLSKQLTKAQNTLEGEQEYLHRIVSEHNELMHYLDELFSLKVYSDGMEKEGDRLVSIWTVEYPGGKLTGYRTIPEAFKAGVEASLEKYREWNEGKR